MIIEKGLGGYVGRLSNQQSIVFGFTRMEVINQLLKLKVILK